MGEIEEYHFRRKTRRKLSLILSILEELNQRSYEMSAELDQLIQQVSETQGVEESVLVLLEGIRARIEELIASEKDLAATKAELVVLAADLDTSEQKVAEAVANFPVPPTP